MVKIQFENFITEFLGITIIKNSVFDWDLWSGIHIIFGGLIILLLATFIKKPLIRLAVLFGILVAWEVFEFVLYGVVSPPMISPESPQNVFWDMVFSMMGGLLAELFIWIIPILNKS